jgi:hypothetical protein
MKKNILFILSVVVCFSEFSCNKDFLSKTDPTRVGANDFYKNQKELQHAVDGVYGQLQGIINGLLLYNELTSDNTTIDFNPGDRGQAPSIEAFEFWTVNSGTGNINSMYVSYYNALYNINNTLAKLKNATTIADSIRAKFEGQL